MTMRVARHVGRIARGAGVLTVGLLLASCGTTGSGAPNPTGAATAGSTTAMARRVTGTTTVLRAAVADIVATGDVGKHYARATRRAGDKSLQWRLASVLFVSIQPQLRSQGAQAANHLGVTLAQAACADLLDDSPSTGLELTGAKPIKVRATSTTVPTSTPPMTPATQISRSCNWLEEAPRPFDGNWLSLEVRGQFPEQVTMVQSQLNWLGYGCTPEDGDYGPETAGLVRDFQRDQGLTVDGVVGPETWGALFGYRD